MIKSKSLYTLAMASMLVTAISACSTTSESGSDQDAVAMTQETDVRVRTDMEKDFGIEVDSVRLASANYMLNFKYKVIDPDKAAPLHNRKIDPYIVLERNGSRFSVPVTQKLGAIRSSPKFAKAGKNYFMFFGNPGGYIKSGDLITIVIGDFKVEHIEVM